MVPWVPALMLSACVAVLSLGAFLFCLLVVVTLIYPLVFGILFRLFASNATATRG